MKKLLIPICILFSLSTRGQNIGIGTAFPQARLHIVNGFSGYSGGYFPGAVIEGAGSSYLSFLTPNNQESGLLFGKPSNGASAGIIYNNPGSPDGLQFRTGGNNTWMTINSTGNIGIGRTDPEVPLHFANTTGEKISFYGSAGNNFGIAVAGSSAAGFLIIHSNHNASDIVMGDGSGAFFNERMRIRGDGRVGIGTGGPTEKLDVVGNVKASSYKYSSPKTFYYSVPCVAFHAKFGDHPFNSGPNGARYESTDVNGEVFAPVYLPHGAVVTSVTCYYFDNSPGVELEFKLLAMGNGSGMNLTMATITSVAISGFTSGTDNTIDNPQIDNQTFNYFITVYSRQGALILPWPGIDLDIRSVLITYTVNEPQ